MYTGQSYFFPSPVKRQEGKAQFMKPSSFCDIRDGASSHPREQKNGNDYSSMKQEWNISAKALVHVSHTLWRGTTESQGPQPNRIVTKPIITARGAL